MIIVHTGYDSSPQPMLKRRWYGSRRTLQEAVVGARPQVAAQLWNFPDRTTAIGQMINAYLASNAELDDGTIHLLFSANRWEKRWGTL